MKKKNSFKAVFMLTTIFLLTLFNNMTFCAEPLDKLKVLLIDLEGWKAEKAEGLSVNTTGMKMINATRNYRNGDMNLDVTILIGSNVMIQGQTMLANVETSDIKVTTSKIDGFDVVQNFNKKENNGYIVIILEKKIKEGSLFMIAYTGISSKEALKIAKKYDLEKMKTITSKLMD